jgi:hypothetical protein
MRSSASLISLLYPNVLSTVHNVSFIHLTCIQVLLEPSFIFGRKYHDLIDVKLVISKYYKIIPELSGAAYLDIKTIQDKSHKHGSKRNLKIIQLCITEGTISIMVTTNKYPLQGSNISGPQNQCCFVIK